ncbi:hypothetical protein MNBD_CHLOROFLEXI01-2226 [hydrothermal vent metagenome]|uniref:Fe-S metabolism associated domain-containing protein n=1 Tax=hydrothermal vent metagenome TaxID=652676 RepID=A0A3B0UWR1_9ZZZZ
MRKLPERLEEIIEDFNYCEGQEKLEYLLEFAESLPPLPNWLQGRQAEMDQVHECITPIFIYPEKKGDGFFFHFDIPQESPTVRGFGAVLQQAFDGATLAQLQAVPNEFYLKMGLQSVLSGQRLNGISAMLAHMKRLAADLSIQ